MNYHILPSLIAKSQEELDALIEKARGSAGLMQLDAMDGQFVPNSSLDFDLKVPEDIEFEAHLMVSNVDLWLKRFLPISKTVIFHFEAVDDPLPLIYKIKKAGKRAGIAINPKTALSKIEPLLPELDEVLVMTVEPGFYGSPFVPEAVEKVEALRKMKPELDIEVDGSINDTTLSTVKRAGANLFVVGSFLMKADDISVPMEVLSDKLKS